MENKSKSKSYELVAWTENGHVRMIPSLVNEMKVPYEEKIERIKSQDYDNEIGWLIRLSKAWEEYARFFMELGYYRQAYQCYDEAAQICTDCSDGLWCQSETCEFPTLPLLYRFFSMHNRCRKLIKEHPSLKHLYDGSFLERSYLFFTKDDRQAEREFHESCESMRAWHFGRR